MKEGRSYSFIIQGEGKGHFSQALALQQLLSEEGGTLKKVYVGRSFFAPLPGYFYGSLPVPVRTFFSPNFVRTSNKKGIRLLSSLILNGLLGPLYFMEALRLGFALHRSGTSIYNFYDPVGGLACRLLGLKKRSTVISHHFYLTHPDFNHPFGWDSQYALLRRLNRILKKSAGRVWALSFRKGRDSGKIHVVPPLLDLRVRGEEWTRGERDLAYFLNPGFVEDLLEYYRRNPDLKADVFSTYKPGSTVPGNVTLHTPSRADFLDKLLRCRRLITTAGFDLVAEAFYLGIPVYVIPAEQHYEQYCNALDASRTGMAFQLEQLDDLKDAEFEARSNKKYREWVDAARSQVFLS